MFYKGAMFPQWNGSALVSGLGSRALIRITFDTNGGAQTAERWDVGRRIRDVEAAPDGALWMLEDAKPGGVFRVTPVGMAVSVPTAQPALPTPSHTGSQTPNSGKARDIKSIIADNSCLTCHHIGRQGGEVGGSLNGVGTRRTADQIRASIVSPPPKTSAGIPNPMPSYASKLSEDELRTLVEYLRTLPAKP